MGLASNGCICVDCRPRKWSKSGVLETRPVTDLICTATDEPDATFGPSSMECPSPPTDQWLWIGSSPLAPSARGAASGPYPRRGLGCRLRADLTRARTERRVAHGAWCTAQAYAQDCGVSWVSEGGTDMDKAPFLPRPTHPDGPRSYHREAWFQQCMADSASIFRRRATVVDCGCD